MILWLVGMMGAGKTSVGKRVAGEIGEDFFDTDAEIAQRLGCSIAQLWGDLGEAAFRDLERATISRVATRHGVAATGGGAPVDAGNREVMRESGRTVWLQAAPETLAERIGDPRGRPLLSVTPLPAIELARLLEERSAHYSAVSDLEIDTEAMTIDEVVTTIVGWWQS